MIGQIAVGAVEVILHPAVKIGQQLHIGDAEDHLSSGLHMLGNRKSQIGLTQIVVQSGVHIFAGRDYRTSRSGLDHGIMPGAVDKPAESGGTGFRGMRKGKHGVVETL